MKLTLSFYGKTHSAEDQCDDLNIRQVVGLFRAVLLSAGYHPDTIRDAIGPEGDDEL